MLATEIKSPRGKGLSLIVYLSSVHLDAPSCTFPAGLPTSHINKLELRIYPISARALTIWTLPPQQLPAELFFCTVLFLFFFKATNVNPSHLRFRSLQLFAKPLRPHLPLPVARNFSPPLFKVLRKTLILFPLKFGHMALCPSTTLFHPPSIGGDPPPPPPSPSLCNLVQHIHCNERIFSTGTVWCLRFLGCLPYDV